MQSFMGEKLTEKCASSYISSEFTKAIDLIKESSILRAKKCSTPSEWYIKNSFSEQKLNLN